jgi:RimJ/RimL family protein N-acetyltransferase
VGPVVTKQLLHLGCTSHQLNRIMLTVSDSNMGGLNVEVKAGFVGEGCLRQASCRQGVLSVHVESRMAAAGPRLLAQPRG